MKNNRTEQLHPLSLRYLENTDLRYRKNLGQYFTPENIRNHLLKNISIKDSKNLRLLDPACGSGEFLISAKNLWPKIIAEGWEIDPKLSKLARIICPDCSVRTKDALKTAFKPKYDIIVGNPPYFEFKPDKNLKSRYIDVISGRPNIFSFFIKLGLEMLNENGRLGFVVPPSMNNGAFFKNLRQYIVDRAEIEHLEILNSPGYFHRALQTVMIIVLRKTENSGRYIFQKDNLMIFTPDSFRLKKAFKGKTTLNELGCKVKTGRIVWNEHKEKLTDDPKNSVLLIRSENINANKIALIRNPSYPQYIKSDNPDSGPAIVVNRVTGNHNELQIKTAVVKPEMKFLAENHVNVIYPPAGTGLKKLENIASQISSKETVETMKLVTGNTQISKTELERLLPIDPL